MSPENEQPGLVVRRIIPSMVDFKFDKTASFGPENQDVEFSLGGGFGISDDKKTASVMLKAILFIKKDGKEILSLTVEMLGDFESKLTEPYDWTPFTKVNGPAIIFPYLREVITDLTSKVGLTTILPPMNIAAAIAESEKGHKK